MNIQQLQRTIVDALEDIKAHDIRIFNTTHLTAMFDRVVVASGTSNRQTKALAASVRDKVKAAGGHIVSIEGEETGEWVLVDCGDAIVHIMQPAIRQYYHLEDLWGDKPVALKSPTTSRTASDTTAAEKKPARKTAARKTAAKTAPAKPGAAKRTGTAKPRTPAAVKTTSAKKTTANKVATTKAAPTKATPTKAATPKRAPARKTARRP